MAPFLLFRFRKFSCDRVNAKAISAKGFGPRLLGPSRIWAAAERRLAASTRTRRRSPLRGAPRRLLFSRKRHEARRSQARFARRSVARVCGLNAHPNRCPGRTLGIPWASGARQTNAWVAGCQPACARYRVGSEATCDRRATCVYREESARPPEAFLADCLPSRNAQRSGSVTSACPPRCSWPRKRRTRPRAPSVPATARRSPARSPASSSPCRTGAPSKRARRPCP